MYPILLQLGPITIYALWICAAIGFLVTFLIIYKLLQKDRNAIAFLADNSLTLLFGGILAARISFVIENYKIYFAKLDILYILEIFYIWDKGLSFWGGMVGIVLVLMYICKQKKESLWKWLDVFTIGGMGGLVFGCLGRFLDGSNYGNETDLPWGVIIENSRYAVPIHPTQIYAMIYTLAITITLWNLRNTPYGKKEGNITLVGTLCYAGFRFLEEFLRGDESNYILGLREGQIFCLLGLVTAGTLLYRRHKKAKTPIITAKTT